MLQQAIAITRSLASQIAATSAASPTISQTQADVANFTGNPLSTIDELRTNMLSFAEEGVSQLTSLLAATDMELPPLAAELSTLQTQAQQLQSQISPALQLVSSAVTTFSGDVGALQNAAASLDVQIAALTAKRDQASDEANKIADRIKWIDGFSTVLPILKLADELESLISSQKTTEQQLADAESNLQSLVAQSNALNSAMQLSTSLSTTVSQLANATQSLANATNLVASELTTQVQSSTPAQAKIFALALEGNLKAVISLAS